jgi:hypothetical protein
MLLTSLIDWLGIMDSPMNWEVGMEYNRWCNESVHATIKLMGI